MLGVDASVVVGACLAASGFDPFRGESLVAPPLLWSEAASAIHELRWRGAISAELGAASIDRLDRAPVASRRPRHLIREAWRVADDLGWAKTYDAEYVALARVLRCRLVTIDARLQRSASRIVEVIGPTEL